MPEAGDEREEGDPRGEDDATPQSDASAAARPGPQPHYEEVTLADLLDVLIRRRRLVVATFLLVVLGVVAFTALSTPTYASQATIVPTNEKAALLSVMESDSFAADAAQRIDVVDELGDGNATRAGQALLADVSVREGEQQVGGSSKQIIAIEATADAPERAQLRAAVWVDTLEDWRGYLEKVTRDKVWRQYYEDAGKNATKAEQQVQALVQGMGYYQPLDPASEAEKTSPDWRLNLALGGTLGAMLALFVPFLVEGVSTALDQRRGSKGTG